MSRMQEAKLVGIALAGLFCGLGLLSDWLARQEPDPFARERLHAASHLFWFMGGLMVLVLIYFFHQD